MQTRELVELAAFVAERGPALVDGDRRIPPAAIEQYWVHSKVRLDRWARVLHAGETRPPRETRAVIEEILAAEMLTRVWTAVLCAHDRRHGADDAEAVARSVMIGHAEARHRALTILARDDVLAPPIVAELDRLRRCTERWTDVLMGRLTGLTDVSEFAVDPTRAKSFGEGLYEERSSIAWPLTLTSLRAAFGRLLLSESPNADLNARIAECILACFPLESLAGGPFRSLRGLRPTDTADDVLGVIDELLAELGPHGAVATESI